MILQYYQFSLPNSFVHFLYNPFTPKSDQLQISPAALPDTLHHTVWRTWLPQLTHMEETIVPILTTSPIHFSLGRLGECTFWTWEWRGWKVWEMYLSLGVKGSVYNMWCSDDTDNRTPKPTCLIVSPSALLTVIHLSSPPKASRFCDK